jgi:hypothetical protein
MTLRQHMRERHPRLPMRRSNRDLHREHARHHLHAAFSHIHVGEPESRGSSHVEGWLTGEILRERNAR